MTHSKKIKKIAELVKVMEEAEKMPADWDAYNKACEQIDELTAQAPPPLT